MLNYTEAVTPDLKRSKTAVYDVLSDIQGDMRGMSLSLMAIAEQPAAVEPEQLNTLSAITHYIDGALGDVLEHLRTCGAPASADKTETSRIDYDDMRDAVTSVKGCAAAMTALYLQEGGTITYSADLFEVLAGQLHGAARYLDGILETL